MQYIHGVSGENVQMFVKLGAVKFSHSEDFPDLVYFWDSQGREIGYVCTIDDSYIVFSPHYREWSQENLSRQKFISLRD